MTQEDLDIIKEGLGFAKLFVEEIKKLEEDYSQITGTGIMNTLKALTVGTEYSKEVKKLEKQKKQIRRR